MDFGTKTVLDPEKDVGYYFHPVNLHSFHGIAIDEFLAERVKDNYHCFKGKDTHYFIKIIVGQTCTNVEVITFNNKLIKTQSMTM